jgi:periplasmic divalent cation tolerance protein
MSGHVEIQITCGDAAEADTLATALVARRLAACVQQIPIRSTYRWNGAVERDDEILLLVKSTRERYADVERIVLDLHSYDVPAITCVEIVAGSPSYLDWIDTETA